MLKFSGKRMSARLDVAAETAREYATTLTDSVDAERFEIMSVVLAEAAAAERSKQEAQQ
jgi:hypothetical protein